jgi:cytidyltransferase-like protein
MSGSAGGDRVKRQYVEPTVNDYISKVLKNFSAFKGDRISGSYNSSNKKDFGDIDLIIHLDSDNKKDIKKELIKYLLTLPNNVIVPFKSEKYNGKKYLSTGEIITILYPIKGHSDQYVQIDNIISISSEESEFKKEFLDYPAEVQGLLLGLVKITLLEEPVQTVLDRLGIKNISKLEQNQEYEFNLSSSGLTLRTVTLDNFKEIDRTDVWKSSNWNDVKELFINYDIDNGFEVLLKDIVSKIKNPRSKNRIRGMFNSMVSIKSGEIGTPKGDNKQKSLDTVNTTLKEFDLGKYVATALLEQDKHKIAIFPGAFKPPHKGHFDVLKQILPKVDRVIIILSPKTREGITADDSSKIWELYKTLLIEDTGRVEIKIAEISPIKDTYDVVQENLDTDFLVVYGKDDADRYKNMSKFHNVEIFDGGSAFEGINATGLRAAIAGNSPAEIQKYLPEGVDIKDFMNILKKDEYIKEIQHQNTDDTYQQYVQSQETSIEVAAEEFNFPIPDLQYAFISGNMVVLTDDIWGNLENSNSYKVKTIEEAISLAKQRDKNWKQTYKAIKNGDPVNAPLVLNYEKDHYYLVEGDSCLAFYKALNKIPKVLLGVINPDQPKPFGLKESKENKREKKEIIYKAIQFFCKINGINKNEIKIKFVNKPLKDTFGQFNPETEEIVVCIGNRYAADYTRTIFHELFHLLQKREGKNMDGTTGSSIENEANAGAGILMRKFKELHPEIFLM